MEFFASRWPAALFWPLSRLFGAAVARRNRRFDSGAEAIVQLDCPVISVGNIVVGGTGKTPTVIFLARWLQRQGKRVCVLSRGYRRKSHGLVVVSDGERLLAGVEESGDEPMLIARLVPGAIVMVDADRVNGGRIARQRFQPDLILLDDGFQHRRLYRDLDIVTFKGGGDTGNGWLLPAGPLREPLTALHRADLIWFTGGETPPPAGIGAKQGTAPGMQTAETVRRAPARLKAAAGSTAALLQAAGGAEKPLLRARLQICGAANAAGAELESPAGRRVLLFCGLAQPQHFLASARSLGLDVVRLISYKDHHQYSQRDIRELEKARQRARADFIITTDKDWVKIEPALSLPPHWFHLSVILQPEDPPETERILQSLCGGIGIL